MAFQRLNYNLDLPFMSGTNKGEGFLFTVPFQNYDSVRLNLVELFGIEDARKVMDFYNISESVNDDDFYDILSGIKTDFIFRCPTRNTMSSSVHSIEGNVGWLYHFNYVASYVKHVWYYLPQCWHHVCHTEELPLVFNPDYSPIYVWLTEQEKMGSNQLQFMWTNFAETGNPTKGPHADNLWTEWMDYGYLNAMESERSLMIDNMTSSGMYMVNGYDAVICDFWDELGYKWFDGTR